VPTPASIAVIGASRRPRSVGRIILQNIITGGFRGPVDVVNPGAAELDGIACAPSAAALPESADLAVITAPPAAVVAIAQDIPRQLSPRRRQLYEQLRTEDAGIRNTAGGSPGPDAPRSGQRITADTDGRHAAGRRPQAAA
jgi:predicted CoA-binding protein